jgi:hypothetical protein
MVKSCGGEGLSSFSHFAARMHLDHDPLCSSPSSIPDPTRSGSRRGPEREGMKSTAKEFLFP